MRNRKPIELANPEAVPGYYLVALTRGGWKVPALLEIREGWIVVTTDGVVEAERWRADDLSIEFAQGMMGGNLGKHPLLRIMLWGEPCDEDTYQYRSRLRDWARIHQPTHPSVAPLIRMHPGSNPLPTL